MNKVDYNRAEQVFNIKNHMNNLDDFIDLHGQTAEYSKRVVELRLKETQKTLDSGAIWPNTGNGKDHLWKVICGKGNHSGRAGPTIKFRVAEWLEENKIEHFADLDGGVFLIRLTKNKTLTKNEE